MGKVIQIEGLCPICAGYYTETTHSDDKPLWLHRCMYCDYSFESHEFERIPKKRHAVRGITAALPPRKAEDASSN